MKAYTVVISKDGKQKSLEINSTSGEGVRTFVKDKYPGWSVVRITKH